MGDVAMTVPVVKSLAQQYPDLRITVLSKPFARTLFDGLAPNVSFMGADIKGEYHGIKGLNALYRRLTAKNFTAIADLHSILRSSYLRMRFNFDRYRVAHIDKHRAMRRALTATNNKQLVQLPTPFEGYADVLAQLGYPVNINFTSIFPPEGGDLKLIAPFINGKSKGEEDKKLSEREKAIREETACEGAEAKVLSEKEEEEVKAESLKPRGEKWIGIAPLPPTKAKYIRWRRWSASLSCCSSASPTAAYSSLEAAPKNVSCSHNGRAVTTVAPAHCSAHYTTSWCS